MPELFADSHRSTPHPVLFNAWKHHAGWIREQIHAAATHGESALPQLAESIFVIGDNLMDLYLGQWSPWQLGEQFNQLLQTQGVFDYQPFADWLTSQGHYGVMTLPTDDSTWTFRLGVQEDRYIHLHPGRYSKHTIRVQASTLKTAIMAIACGVIRGASPLDLGVINPMRKQFLDLPPIKEVSRTGGLGEIIQLLQLGGSPVTDSAVSP